MGMFDFIGDIFGGGGGDQQQPQIMSTQDLINQTYGTLQSTIPGVTAYNQALQPLFTGLQLSSENQVFGPAANQLQQGTYQSILDQLNMGESLSPELTADITRKLLESGSTTGFGASPGGIGNIILQTALEGERRGQMRRNEALGAVNLLPSSRYQFQPQGLFTPQQIAGDIRGVQAAEQEAAAFAAAQQEQEFNQLFSTGLQIAGTVAGGIFGGGLPGAMAGGALGSIAGQALFPTTSGSGSTQAFTSTLSGFGGFGSPPLGEPGGFPTPPSGSNIDYNLKF